MDKKSMTIHEGVTSYGFKYLYARSIKISGCKIFGATLSLRRLSEYQIAESLPAQATVNLEFLQFIKKNASILYPLTSNETME